MRATAKATGNALGRCVCEAAGRPEGKTEVSAWLAAAKPIAEATRALLVPLASLLRSGRLLGGALGAAREVRPRRLVLVAGAPGLDGIALPPEGGGRGGWGRVAMDEPAIDLLSRYPRFRRDAAAFEAPESASGLGPFFERLWPDAQLVPVLVGRLEPGATQALARDLRQILDEDALLIAAANLGHHGAPWGEPLAGRDPGELQRAIEALEEPLVAAVLGRDRGALEEIGSSGRVRLCEASGAAALLALVELLGPGEPGVQLGRGTSLEGGADEPGAVSYLAARFGGRWPSVAELDPEDRLTLAQIAEETVAATVTGRNPRLPEVLSPRLRQPGAAFVTLTQRGRLRGCMGRLQAVSLAEAVRLAAGMACSSDPRFPALREDDLASIELEISVLGPFRAIASAEEYEPGRHGLILTHGWSRGLLLPQVATKYGMGREEFLEALAEKAGLPAHAWRDAKLERFGVEAFEPKPVVRRN